MFVTLTFALSGNNFSLIRCDIYSFYFLVFQISGNKSNMFIKKTEKIKKKNHPNIRKVVNRQISDELLFLVYISFYFVFSVLT